MEKIPFFKRVLISVLGESVAVGLPYEETVAHLNQGMPGNGISVRVHCLYTGRIKTFSMEDNVLVRSKLKELRHTWKQVVIREEERTKVLCNGTMAEIVSEFGQEITIDGVDISKELNPKKRKAKRRKRNAKVQDTEDL